MASITLRQLVTDTATAIIHFDEGDLEVVYSPSKLSPADLESMQKAQDGKDAVERTKALVTYLAGVLVKWNLGDDDGTPMPITFDTLYALPLSLLTRIITSLQAKESVGEAKGETSAAA